MHYVGLQDMINDQRYAINRGKQSKMLFIHLYKCVLNTEHLDLYTNTMTPYFFVLALFGLRQLISIKFNSLYVQIYASLYNYFV